MIHADKEKIIKELEAALEDLKKDTNDAEYEWSICRAPKDGHSGGIQKLGMILASYEMTKHFLSEVLQPMPYMQLLTLNAHISSTALLCLERCITGDKKDSQEMFELLTKLHSSQIQLVIQSKEEIEKQKEQMLRNTH